MEKGDGGGTKSIVDTEYATCACSPLGKVKRVSQPYAPGGTVYWTTYNYDSLGRTISVIAPDGASTGSYLYQGNTVRVTDPAGNWKTFTTDALGNLVQVTEPNPAGGENLETYYTYNLFNKLTSVSMPRSGYTQTRSLQYDDAGLLTLATNPENGAVNYYYNSDGTLNYRTDAKSQKVSYEYDSYQRVTQIHRYPNGVTEDLCQGTQFTYDTNPIDPAYSQNAWGRVTVASWGGANCSGGALSYMYSYTQGGLITGKRLRVGAHNFDLDVGYTHNNEGQMTSVTYPNTYADGETVWGARYTLTYNGMGQPSHMTRFADGVESVLVNSVLYGAAGEMVTFDWETRTYNSRLQLTSITSPGSVNMEYRYSPTQNNGKITSQKNNVTGEEVNYAYDSLQRLISAVTTGPQWGLSFSYDGFGNRTAQTLTKGTAPTFAAAADPVTNRLVGQGYDSNGNMTSTLSGYDVENRLTQLFDSISGITQYAYDPSNKRVWKQWQQTPTQTADEYHLYGAYGEEIGTYKWVYFGIDSTTYAYFAGRRLVKYGLITYRSYLPDRVGSDMGKRGDRRNVFFHLRAPERADPFFPSPTRPAARTWRPITLTTCSISSPQSACRARATPGPAVSNTTFDTGHQPGKRRRQRV